MITIISAISQNKVIGFDNKIPWKSSEDIEKFREIITGKIVVMGRKTFESLKNYFPENNGHPLALKNIVLSTTLQNIPGIEIYKTPKDILEKYKNNDLFIIGGSQIYKEFLSFSDEIDLTIIPGNYDGDSFFPDFENDFRLVGETKGKSKNIVFQKWVRNQ
ncbi:MAG: dihydrofolate reductase [Candidatus Gracilibacteria bacterium]|nr:dihydrofolate reductase [Candidatus Gracilibacteria bacterium]